MNMVMVHNRQLTGSKRNLDLVKKTQKKQIEQIAQDLKTFQASQMAI